MDKSAAGLTGEGLARLLASLDADRERAGERYVLLRQKLVSFFDWNGARFPEECADETLNVAARRIAGGEPVRNIAHYCIGIARLVLLARDREDQRFTTEDAAPARPAPDRSAGDDVRLGCLEQCLDGLPPESRQLILAYYDGAGPTKIRARRALAARLGIAPNALRIRAHRIRAGLEESMRRLLADRLERGEMK